MSENNSKENSAIGNADPLNKLQEHVSRIKSLEAALYQEQQAYRSELKRQRTDLSVRERVASQSKEQKEQLKGERKALQAMERARPTETPLLLWAALGSANLMLPDRERLRYKASYERFKVVLTITHLCLAVLLIFMDHWTWLDAVSNFVLVYAYSTMTLRESILQLNGSSLHPWWIWHHYLCILLAGMLLIWPNTPVYRSMRTQLLYFMVYTAAVQILQYRYQMNRLYTLRALSRVNAMQTTTDSAMVHVSNSLAFLLPFLLGGHAWQFYNAYALVTLAYAAGIFKEWHAAVAGVLFLVLALGNLSTTLWTLYLKRQRMLHRKTD